MAIEHIHNIKKALEEKKYPTAMMWNRLEGRPKTHHFDRALKAEIRDALWILTRQWQMGEFKADDAGSPVFAKIHIETLQLDTYNAAKQTAQPFERNIPLEVKVEQKKIPFTRNNKEISIDLRLQMGNYWLTLINDKGLNYRSDYVRLYGFELPVKERSTDYIYAHKEVWQQYAAIAGRSVDGYKLYAYLKEAGNTAADGVTVNDPDKTALNDLGIGFIQWYEKQYYQPVEEKNNAWLPEHLEYQFDCSANSVSRIVKNLHAEEYYQGSPEWYVFDIGETDNGNGVQEEVKFTSSFIPAHVEFDGMPNTRWWKFEDGKTNLGDVKPSTTDLGKLLLMEFGLVFANDWFVIPYTLPVGTLSTIAGLTVKNNFGEKFWIESTEKTEDKDVWSMFKMNAVNQNKDLFLSPTSLKVHESEPLEDIILIRDEISNMVWGIEKIVPSAIGTGTKGSETAIQIRQYHEKIVLKEWLRLQSQAYKDMIASFPTMAIGLPSTKSNIEQSILTLVTGNPERDLIISKLSDSIKRFTATFDEILDSLKKVNISLEDLQQEYKKTAGELIDQLLAIIKAEFENASDKTNLNATIRYLELQKNNAYAANISYLAMTDVPENWIPFSPVHKKNDNREIQLQRSTMLRFIEGDQQVKTDRIKPKTSLLREGLEVKPTAQPYFIHEEEVPRSGVRVYQSYQRTRWTNGEVFLWLGIKKKPGRGEGSSGLAFDQIVSRT